MTDQEPRLLARHLARGLARGLTSDVASDLARELPRELESNIGSDITRSQVVPRHSVGYKDGRHFRAIDPDDPLIQWNVKVPSKVKREAERLAYRRRMSVAALVRHLVMEAARAERK